MFSRLMIAVATTVLTIVTSCLFPAVSLSKSAIAQVPGVYPFKLGDFTITVLSDGTLPQDLHTLLSNTNPIETDRLLQKNFALSRRWTPPGSRSRLCLGASGLPLA